MLQNQFAKWGDKMFEEHIAKIVKKHAFWAAFFTFIPLWGIELIPFVIILWHMYSRLCEESNTKMQFGTYALGFIVNIVVAAALLILLDFVPIIGWLGKSFTTYLQFYFSGKIFISTLRAFTGYKADNQTASITSNNAAKLPPPIPTYINSSEPQYPTISENVALVSNISTIKTDISNDSEKNNLELSSSAEKLYKLKELLDAGVLSQEEFDVEKKIILNSNNQ